MKITPLFSKHQDLILKFANTNFGKDVLASHHRDLPILKVTPNAIVYLRDFDGKKANLVANFYSKPVFAKKFATALSAIDIAKSSFNDLRAWYEKPELILPSYAGLILPRRDLPNIMMTVSQFYSDANPETSTFDGYTGFDYNNTEYSGWAAHRGATSSGASSFYLNDSSTNIYVDVTDPNSANKFSIVRGFMLYDTSVITAGGVINSASWNWQYSSVAVDSTAYSWVDKLYLTTSSPASNTGLVVGDFDQIGFTAQASAQTSVSTKSINTAYSMALNATGLSNISKTGITKFGVVQGNDFENTDPNAGTGTAFRVNIYSADAASRDQYLEIDYTPASSSFMSLMGVGK
jgi:hypothetical protein